MKLNLIEVFQTASSKLMGNQFPLVRKDRDSKGGGKIVFVWEVIVAIGLFHCERPRIESKFLRTPFFTEHLRWVFL